jgi:protein-S-isoprenylcysteine O-methyltransferase Ste14
MKSFLFVLPILSVVALASARLLEIYAKREGIIRGPVKENLTFRLFMLAGLLVALGSIAEYLLLRAWFSWVLFGVGWVLGILSFWIRNAAISALGKFWSLHVEIRDNHEFVRNGPFRVVRHPVYFSMILELLAFAFVCSAWIVALIIPFIYVPVLLMRVRMEEEAMIDKFGETYREYRRTTPAIFPRLW